ncbi:hypothetical protein HG537_0A04900 [Torulaspora globosa]|uniref:UBA domain-containing protein n=1 Tax=Torulaspora globosa TaxID=48254 RepID=A0A7H9HLS8_9SACH|nr:hypothetical protein HG537_0A04900 [Torulaspora sp. CBS 2947]
MDAIQSLMEMGIERDVAEEALKRTDGDVEAAGNLIFSNELTGGISENVGQSAHVELPAMAGDGCRLGDVNEYAVEVPRSDSEGWEEIEVEDEYNQDETSVEELCLKSQISVPTVVSPLPPNFLFENYFALYCLFVSNYLPHIVAKPDFKDLNYDKEWYRGNGLRSLDCRVAFVSKDDGDDEEAEILPKDQLSTEEQEYTLQPELLWQLQRLSSVVNSRISDRAYVRAKMFAIALEPQVQRKLGDVEHLYEILPSFIKSLTVDLEMCPGFNDNDVRQLFISSAFHTPTNPDLQEEPTTKTWLSLFHFLPEEYDTNLYRMFHILLYPEDTVEDGDEQLPLPAAEENENSLCDIAPVLTIVFDEMEENTDSVPLAEGVEIPLQFYPQLYTKRCKDKLIMDIIAKRKQSQLDSRAILQEIANLKSFQGKDILKFINSSLDYLQKDDKPRDTIDALLSVKDYITEQKTQKMNEYKKLAHRLQTEWNLSHPEIQVIQTAKDLGLIDEPYQLVMAVISPYMYFSRDRNGQWYYVRSRPHEPGTHVRACSSPLEVQDSIKQFTRQPSESPLMFIYCKESFIPNDETVWKALENNQGCTKFAKEDQLQLNKMRDQSISSISSTSASVQPAL